MKSFVQPSSLSSLILIIIIPTSINVSVKTSGSNHREPGRFHGHRAPEEDAESLAPLADTKVYLGKPCNQSVYDKLFNTHYGAKYENGTKMEFLKFFNKESFRHPIHNKTEYFFKKHLGDLCIEVYNKGVVDIFKYDCRNNDTDHFVAAVDYNTTVNEDWSRKGYCHCGHTMNWVDLNIPPIIIQSNFKSYYRTISLDRNLILENNECVSGIGGHCNDTLAVPLKCADKLECVLIEKEGKRFVNLNTTNTYGMCLKRGLSNDTDSFNRGHKLERHRNPLIPVVISFIIQKIVNK